MSKLLIVVVVVVLIILLVGSMFVGMRNSMVRKEEGVATQWAQVDTAIKRRADLIPNLVETVKGIAGQEQAVFGQIAAARSALLSAKTPGETIAANGSMDSAIGRLLAVVENYPQLRSSENFLRLQDELAGTENRIAVERRSYNETVNDYNVYIRTFPNNVVAGMFGFNAKQRFEASESDRAVPKVDFGIAPAGPRPTQQPSPAPAR